MSEYEYALVKQQQLAVENYIEACNATNDYSVSLASGDKPIGSATLVSIGKHLGFLTADHVWQRLLNDKHEGAFCIVIENYPHRFEYSYDECSAVIVGEYSSKHALEGPDLTFVRLNNLTKVGTIKSLKSFYPLSSENLKLFELIPYEQCPWIIWGAPAEISSLSRVNQGEDLLKIGHFSGAGDFIEKF